MWNKRLPRARGVTLVELIIAIVIVGVAVAGLSTVLARVNTGSADPLILQQKVAIAESLMGEILLKPYTVDTTSITPGVRDTYNDVQDFNGYDSGTGGIMDVSNSPVAGLKNYRVRVSVTSVALAGMPSSDALKIAITVSYATDGANDAYVLTGWRTKP